jgi:hypothetical protein
MSAAGQSKVKTGVQPPATHSGKDSTVRTLTEPPDIWELVHESRADFKPGSAFVGHLKALHPLVLFMILLVVAGGGIFGFMKFRSWSASSSNALPVPTETSKTVFSPLPALPNHTSADQSTNKATAPAQSTVSTVDEPKTSPAAPPALSETKAAAASSESKVIVKPRPQSSTTATGETVATRNKEKARASKLTAAASPTTVRTDSKDGNQALPTPAPKSDKPQTANLKKEPDKASSPELTAPAKASATPKPKVIPWP